MNERWLVPVMILVGVLLLLAFTPKARAIQEGSAEYKIDELH